MPIPELAFLFFRLGAVSFGGATVTLGEMQRYLVDGRGLMTAHDFATAYALGQATPGPGVLYLIPIAFRAGGVAGAVVGPVCFLAPPLLFQLVLAERWERLSRSAWIRAADRALVPISVGLIGGSFYVLASPLVGVPRSALALAAGAIALIALRASPPVVVLAAGVLGLLGLF